MRTPAVLHRFHRASLVTMLTCVLMMLFFLSVVLLSPIAMLVNPTAALADDVLSLLQSAFRYYPEDSDPEFFATWMVTTLLWFVALSALVLQGAGLLRMKKVTMASSVYAYVVLMAWLIDAAG